MEVLIASTILFASLAVVSFTFSVNLKSTRTALAAARAVAPVPQIVAIVREQLRLNRSDRVSGKGDILGVSYSFAAATKIRRPPPERFDPDRAEFVRYPERFKLYEVTLIVRSAETVRNFKYLEIAWTDEYEPL